MLCGYSWEGEKSELGDFSNLKSFPVQNLHCLLECAWGFLLLLAYNITLLTIEIAAFCAYKFFVSLLASRDLSFSASVAAAAAIALSQNLPYNMRALRLFYSTTCVVCGRQLLYTQITRVRKSDEETESIFQIHRNLSLQSPRRLIIIFIQELKINRLSGRGSLSVKSLSVRRKLRFQGARLSRIV